jgi:hypothetical protein
MSGRVPHVLEEAWLERLGADAPEQRDGADADQESAAALLAPTTVRSRGSSDEDTVFRCQATQVVDASAPLGWRDVRQYAVDIQNWGVRKILRESPSRCSTRRKRCPSGTSESHAAPRRRALSVLSRTTDGPAPSG